MSLTLKLTSLGIRTVAKPLGNLIKRQAREHEGFRRFCVRFAQGLHQLDARMRLGLLEDSEAIARQIDREAAIAEAKRLRSQHRPSSDTPTAKTKQESEADARAREQERRFIEEKVKNEEKKKGRELRRPLSESKAIDTGANFASEAFVFAIGVGLLLFENWRSRRKASNRREDVDDRLEKLEGDVRQAHDDKAQLQQRVGSLLEELERLRAADAAKQATTPAANTAAVSSENSKPAVAAKSSNSETQQQEQQRNSKNSTPKKASSEPAKPA